MKKNAMLKIAAVLLVAVLLTTCFISSTFAKYTTTGQSMATNEGRVAKWGLKIEKTTANALFLTDYTNPNALAASSNSQHILAPGTSNNVDLGISIEGKPEVAFQVKVKPEVKLIGWYIDDANSDFYCPVKFWINDTNKTPTAALSAADENATTIEAAIAKAILGVTDAGQPDAEGYYVAKYQPNDETFAGTDGKSINITWDWSFDGNSDTNDTILGDRAADANAENDPKIEITFSIKAEQIEAVN